MKTGANRKAPGNVKSLKLRAASGIVWNFIELMLRRGAGGLTTIALAWFLTPEDFGLVAMMAVFLGLCNVLVDAGMGQALIRQVDVSQRDLNTAFYSNIGLAFVAYTALFFSAPAIANFYQEARLILLIQVTGLAIFFNALSVVQRAVLSRKLKFKLQMKVSLPSAVISGATTIVLAYLGAGVWALIIQILLQAMINAVLYWQLRLWRPELSFGWGEFKALFSFSGYLLLNRITTVPYRHMYVIVIAKIFSAQLAGFYFFSQKIRELLIDQLVNSIQTVTFPALATLQHEPERLKKGYRRVIAATTFLVFPVLIFLAALVNNIFHLFLPESWWEAAVYLQLLCIAALMTPLNSINLNILKVKGRSDLVFYLGLFKKLLAVGIFFVSYRYGIIAIILGQILQSVLAYLPNSWYSKQLINYTVTEQLADFMPSLLLAAGIGLVLWWLQDISTLPEVMELILLGSGAVIAYLVGAWVLKLEAPRLAGELLQARIKRKGKSA